LFERQKRRTKRRLDKITRPGAEIVITNKHHKNIGVAEKRRRRHKDQKLMKPAIQGDEKIKNIGARNQKTRSTPDPEGES